MIRARDLFGVGVRLLAVWFWTQAAYTGLWGILKTLDIASGSSGLTSHADFSFAIFYGLLGVFLMAGARALVWLGYGDMARENDGAANLFDEGNRR